MVILTSDNKVLVYDFGRHKFTEDQLKQLIDVGQIETSNVKPNFNLTPHKKPILHMEIPGGNESLIFTLSQENTIKITMVTTGEEVAALYLEDQPSTFCTVRLIKTNRTIWEAVFSSDSTMGP